MADFRKLIRTGIKSFQFSGINGGVGNYYDPYGAYGRSLAGAQYDYKAEAGLPWENSAVMSCVNWAQRVFHDAKLTVQKRDEEGEWVDDPQNPALYLLQNPNKDYPSSLLWSGAVASLMFDGNGYWYIEEDGFTLPRGLYFMPYYQVNPRWDADGKQYITDYAYRTNGKLLSLNPQNVIHFKNGVDMQNTRKGFSPLLPVLREVCTDNEAGTAAAAMMRNMGMPGLGFTPAEGVEMTPDQKQRMRELAREKFTGDRRGEMFISPIPGKMESFGFTPEELAFDAIRRVPEERITACFGIPAVVVGLGAGLERSTFANFSEAREAAYESFMVPLWNNMAEQLTAQLLPAFGYDTSEYRFHFDTKDVKALNENTNDLHARVREDFKAGIIDRETAATYLGYQKSTDTSGRDEFIDNQSNNKDVAE